MRTDKQRRQDAEAAYRDAVRRGVVGVAPHRQREVSLRDEIATALNRASAEGGSNTPDFILAQYLFRCLWAFDEAVCARSRWYGRHDGPGAGQTMDDIDGVSVPK